MINRIRSLFRWVPTSWKSKLEFYFDSSLGKEFGGPFNGQKFRQKIFLDLLQAISFNAIIETGTFRGVTTEFLAENSNALIYTVEAEPRFFHYATLKLRRFKKVRVTLGDSREFITRLIKDSDVPKTKVFFYLDAHWNEDLPLYKEVELIGRHWNEVVIMIDDFEVPDDDGYKFDDYGNGKKLCLDYLNPLLGAQQWSVFFPAAASSEESGIKRGCVVLVNKAMEDEIKNIDSLRLYEARNSQTA